MADLPALPDFVAGDRERHRARLDALVEARGRGADGIAEFEQSLGEPALEPDVVVVALLLSYRSEQAWDRLFGVVQRMRPELAGRPFVRQQHAFALNRAGRGVEAEQILLALREEEGPSPETNGILGRVYKDRFLASRAGGDEHAAEHWLRQATDTYLEGHDADPENPYPGLNALSLMEFAYPKPARRSSLLTEVKAAARRRLMSDETRYWDYATEWELAVLERDEQTAAVAMAKAVDGVEEPWQAASTRYNTQMVGAAWAARGVAVPAWVGEVAALLDPIVPPGDPGLPPGGPGAPPVPPGGPGLPPLPPSGSGGLPPPAPPPPSPPPAPTAPSEPLVPPAGDAAPATTAVEAATSIPARGTRRVLKWVRRLLVTTVVVAIVAVAVVAGLLAFGPQDFQATLEDTFGVDLEWLPEPLRDDPEPGALTTTTTVAPTTTVPPPTTVPVTTRVPLTTLEPDAENEEPDAENRSAGPLCPSIDQPIEPVPEATPGSAVFTFEEVDDCVIVLVDGETVWGRAIVRFDEPPVVVALPVPSGSEVVVEGYQGPLSARLLGRLEVDGTEVAAWDFGPATPPPGKFFTSDPVEMP